MCVGLYMHVRELVIMCVFVNIRSRSKRSTLSKTIVNNFIINIYITLCLKTFIYSTRTEDKVDLSCDNNIMKIVDSVEYCGSLLNKAGSFADCMVKSVCIVFRQS